MNEQGTGVGIQQEVWSGKPCPHCGSSDIVSGLEFGLGTEVGTFGLTYRALAVFRGKEKLQAELCRACGTVVRIYVNNTQQDWIVKKDKKNQI